MKYRKIPWKRGYRKIPGTIISALDTIDFYLIVIAATKKIAFSDVEAGLYQHVGLSYADGRIETAGVTDPPMNSGRWSERNTSGWRRRRRDWPKVSKTYTFETPNFGDAATYGTHMHVWRRDVYQHQLFEPQGMQITAEILGAPTHDHVVVKFALAPLLDRKQAGFELMLLWSLNVLQENTGVCGVYASDASGTTMPRAYSLTGKSSRPDPSTRLFRVLAPIPRHRVRRPTSMNMCAVGWKFSNASSR